MFLITRGHWNVLAKAGGFMKCPFYQCSIGESILSIANETILKLAKFEPILLNSANNVLFLSHLKVTRVVSVPILINKH